MKILHISDIHLGVKNGKLNLDKQILMKNEQISQLVELFDKAYKDDFDIILICGDLFHSKSVPNKIKSMFFNAVQTFARPVLYIKGNHDEKMLFEGAPENFIILDDKNNSYKLQNVNFYNGVSSEVFSNIEKNGEKHVLLLHGNVENQSDNDYIDISKFLGFPFDYVAMGHIHQYEILNIKEFPCVYSGSLFSNGFDECGSKGYVEVMLENDKVEYKFVPFSKRRYIKCECDITGLKTNLDIVKKIKEDLSEQEITKKDLIKIILKGYFDENLDKNIPYIAESIFDYFYVEIEDKSRMKIDLDKYKNETLSFKAEFINIIEGNSELTEEQKNLVCQTGIEALKGEDLSL